MTTVGGITVKHLTHQMIGNCRCSNCVHTLVRSYKQNNRPIRNAPRCTRCNCVLTHPQWIERGGESASFTMASIIRRAKEAVPLAYLCCSCEPILTMELRQLRRGPSYHIQAGKDGAGARRRRRLGEVLINCMICHTAGTQLICEECED